MNFNLNTAAAKRAAFSKQNSLINRGEGRSPLCVKTVANTSSGQKVHNQAAEQANQYVTQFSVSMQQQTAKKVLRKSSFEAQKQIKIHPKQFVNAQNLPQAQMQISYEKELKMYLKPSKASIGSTKSIYEQAEQAAVPDLSVLKRIYAIIDACKTSAYEFFQYLISSNWRHLKRWLS